MDYISSNEAQQMRINDLERERKNEAVTLHDIKRRLDKLEKLVHEFSSTLDSRLKEQQ